MVVNNR